MIGAEIFLFGLIIGSFLNVLIYRIPRSDLFEDSRSDLGSIVYGRSKCPKCKRTLAWYDLIPVLSYLFLKSKCRYCRKRISFRYVFIELLSAFSFFALFLFNKPAGYSDWISLIFWFTAVSLLIVVFFIDLDFLIILDKILLVLGLTMLFYQILREFLIKSEPVIFQSPYSLPGIKWNLLAALLTGLVFLAIFLITRGKGLGMGDVKLIFLLAFMFGFPAILTVVYASLIVGTVYGLILILFFGAKLKSKIPFGSVLSAISVFFILFNKFFVPALLPYILRLYL